MTSPCCCAVQAQTIRRLKLLRDGASIHITQAQTGGCSGCRCTPERKLFGEGLIQGDKFIRLFVHSLGLSIIVTLLHRYNSDADWLSCRHRPRTKLFGLNLGYFRGKLLVHPARARTEFLLVRVVHFGERVCILRTMTRKGQYYLRQQWSPPGAKILDPPMQENYE